MYQETLVLRNFNVLQRLGQGTADVGELATAAKCRTGDLAASLEMLCKQGFIAQEKGTYALRDPSSTAMLLETMAPWVNYQGTSFYELARSAAQIMHGYAWEQAALVHVMLYGSTLRGDSPKDIDMLLIHGGSRLSAFSPYKKLQIDEPVSDVNARDTPFKICKQLGYREGALPQESVLSKLGKRIEPLCAGTSTQEQIERAQRFVETFPGSLPLSDLVDLYGIDNIFDINVLFEKVLLADENDEAPARIGTYVGIRKKAIESCRDPTFWHTILSEGRIYDERTNDFTLTVEERYPGALRYFPSR